MLMQKDIGSFCDQKAPYGNTELGQHWLSNGLLPGGTKPLPEPMLT